MTPEHIKLIQSTVPVLREHGVALTSYFYQRMLKNHPELKNTFNLDHQSSGRQPRALAAAVLAYAEHIENPSVLAKAVDRMTNKHVSLDIQPEQYAIVGENLLHSISEVLNVAMDSELIAAWKEAYTQLAELLIGVEKEKYQTLNDKTGGWTGWREFRIIAVNDTPTGKHFSFIAADGQTIAVAQADESISIRVKVPQQELHQPLQFKFSQAQNAQYDIDVAPVEDASEYSVANILLHHYHVGDVVEISAPLKI